MTTQLGKQKRIDKVLGISKKSFIVPIDDLLICGVDFQLKEYAEKIPLISQLPVDSVLGFPGAFNQFYYDLKNKGWIINISTSTIENNHTEKRLSLTLENAISMGCDAVAVHVNMTSPTEGKMIQNLGLISCECQRYGIPLMAIVYARGITQDGKDENYLARKASTPVEYTCLISHACRVAVELGCDIIKTNYTGTAEEFKKVVYASGDVPVIIAGGNEVTEEEALENIEGALKAGGKGICFGRNFFYRDNLISFSRKVRSILDEYT